jgi:phosphomannomutase/phosphoglucomutase
VRQDYLDRIVGDVKLSRPMKIVVDCGNGVAGAIAPELFRRMGCELSSCSARWMAPSPTTIPIRPSRKT